MAEFNKWQQHLNEYIGRINQNLTVYSGNNYGKSENDNLPN